MSRPVPEPVELPTAMGEWIDAHLPGVCESVEMVADTQRSFVVRLSSAGETFYFKSDRILPPPEAVVLARLARRWPARVPPVVAVDEERGWSLTRDVGAIGLDGATTDTWCRVAAGFAAVQCDPGLDASAWLALGCRDLRGRALFASIETMLADFEDQIDVTKQVALRAALPRIESACDALATDGIPATLVHQDLVPVNIVVRDGEPVFLDWSDTVVGHPFFGFDRLLDSCWNDVDRKAAVIDAYLAGFTHVAEPEHLRASFDRVLSLRVLYECVRWHHELAEIDVSSDHAVLLRKDALAGLSLVAR